MLAPIMGCAAETVTKPFNLPAGDAEKALRDFAEQSGVQVLFSSATATGVRTNAVKGEFVPKEAMNRLLDGTGLVVRLNEKSGALVISRKSPGNSPPMETNGRVTQETESDRPASKKKTMIQLISQEG